MGENDYNENDYRKKCKWYGWHGQKLKTIINDTHTYIGEFKSEICIWKSQTILRIFTLQCVSSKSTTMNNQILCYTITNINAQLIRCEKEKFNIHYIQYSMSYIILS